MANIRDLKTRYTSIGNIAQITGAMEMVATTKLRRFQDRAIASRPYAEQIGRLIQNLASAVDGDSHPLFEEKVVKKRGVLVTTSARGLCGSYNSNVFAKIRDHAKAHEGEELHYFVIGKKGMSALPKRGYHVEFYFEDLNLEKVTFRDAAEIAQAGQRLFLERGYDCLDVIYTAFQSQSRFEATSFQFLPMVPVQSEDEGSSTRDYLLEPSPEAIFDSLVPKYLETRMFNALIESLASEFAMRRISMKNATEAASDMKKDLQKLYNRARQERITKELLEIVGGAEALRG